MTNDMNPRLLQKLGELNAPHLKASEYTPPRKAEHKHEYFRPVGFSYVRFPDGRISEKKLKFYGLTECWCGHFKDPRPSMVIVEIEYENYRMFKAIVEDQRARKKQGL